MAWYTGLDEIVQPNQPLEGYTWLRLGGVAEFFVSPRSVAELAEVLKRSHAAGLPVRLLGGGSKILVSDKGVAGVVIHLGAPAFTHIRIEGQAVTAGAGARLGHVVATSVREGLAGLETLVGIPGTIGGALHGNAGGRGGDIGQWVSQVSALNRKGESISRGRPELVFEYRQSNLDDLVVVEARFALERAPADELTKRMQRQWIVKKAAQPLAHQHTATMFKNPRGMSAGLLIEQAGLKGTRVGGAEISERHANYIVVDDRATPEDVLKLVELVRTRVSDRQGVDLELELEIW